MARPSRSDGGGDAARILVTGGAGYIGSHTCKALAHAGYLPVTVDDLSRGHRWAVKWGPLEAVHLHDARALGDVFARHRPSAVIHFAAFVGAGESVERPDLYYRNNVGSLLAVVEAARAHGLQRVVFSSSAAVYGAPRELPIPEDHPLQPVNPYGWTKVLCERILAVAGDLRAVSLRYFNAAGADPEAELGSAHEPATHLVPLALRGARDPAFTLPIYGEDYETRDGTAVRDYVHVGDLAEAHVQALRHLEAGGPALALNLGTGRGHTVREVVDAVGAVLGRPVKVARAGRRPGDPPALVADARRAGHVLGWRPGLSDLETIVRTAAAWADSAERRGLV